MRADEEEEEFGEYIDDDYVLELTEDPDEELTEKVAELDDLCFFDTHSAVWWDSDTVIPMVRRSFKEGWIRIAMPSVYRAAPTYILDNIILDILSGKDMVMHITADIRQFLKSKAFRHHLRKSLGIGPQERLRSGPLYTAKTIAEQGLRDRPRLVEDTIMLWREYDVDLSVSPICSTNPYARVIWLDRRLKDVDEGMLTFAIWHEYCYIAALNYRLGRPKRTKFALLIARHPQADQYMSMFDAMGWRFEYDSRATTPDRRNWDLEEVTLPSGRVLKGHRDRTFDDVPVYDPSKSGGTEDGLGRDEGGDVDD